MIVYRSWSKPSALTGLKLATTSPEPHHWCLALLPLPRALQVGPGLLLLEAASFALASPSSMCSVACLMDDFLGDKITTGASAEEQSSLLAI